jgi:hypothetical protein
VKEPAVAVNVALADPTATLTEVGTVRLEEEVNPTLAPDAALPLRLTVQVLEAPGPSVVGLHPTLLIVRRGLTVTVPPDEFTVTELPVGSAPRVLLRPSEVGPLTADMVTETVATMPFRIGLLFIPHATQL